MYKRKVNTTEIVVLPVLNLIKFIRFDGITKALKIKIDLYFRILPNLIQIKAINSRDIFRLFWFVVSSTYNSNFVFFADVSVIGLGYRIRVISDSIFRLFLGKTNYIYVFASKDLLLKAISNDTTKVRKLLVLGLSLHLVNKCISALLLLRPLNPYRITGMLDQRKFIFLKTGKRR